jgi:hypothetical protein
MMGSRFSRGARGASVLSALVLLLGAEGARADTPKAGEPTRPAAAAPAANDKAGEEASNHFKRGLQLFDDGDYTLALVEFERAYQLAPNYRALYNIALVDMQLGRYADAMRTLEVYLRDGGDAIAPARRTEVTKKLAELKFRTATVDISTNVPNAEVSLDGKGIDPARLRGPLLIDAGEHMVRASAPGFHGKDRTVTLAGGDRASVRFDLLAIAPTPLATSETTPRGRSPFWPGFVATGVFAAGAVVSGVVMLDARSHLNTLQGTAGSDAGQRETAATRANTAALVADIFSGLAVVAGGVSLYLSFGPDHSAKTPKLAVSPRNVVLSGSF